MWRHVLLEAIEHIYNEISDQHLTEGAVYFRRSGIVLQDATGAALGTTIGAPLRLQPKVHPPPFHQVFMCCLSNRVWSADWSSVSSLRVVSTETRRGDPSQRDELPPWEGEEMGGEGGKQGGAAAGRGVDNLVFFTFHWQGHICNFLTFDFDKTFDFANLVSITFFFLCDFDPYWPLVLKRVGQAINISPSSSLGETF